jgi:hypothetical protein
MCSFEAQKNYNQHYICSEDVMKKVFSILAMALMIVSLAGCMDDPDQGNPKPAGYGTPNQQGSGVE